MANDRILKDYRERVLTAVRLRGLLRTRRTRLVPEQLVEHTRHVVPEIYARDAVRIGEILGEVAATARAELDAAGIVPDQVISIPEALAGERPGQRLNARERAHVTDYAALLAWASEAAMHAAIAPGPGESESRHNRERAVELAEESVQWALTGKDTIQLAVSMLVLSSHIAQLENAVDRAVAIGCEAIGLLENLDEPDARYALLHLEYQRSGFHDLLGEFEAVDNVARRCEELIGSEPNEMERSMRVAVLTMRASAARKRERYQQALEFGRQALRWSNPDFDPATHCKLLQSLGLLYTVMEQWEEGLRMFLDAIAILEVYGLASFGSWVYMNAAQQYVRSGDIPAAHDILDRLEGILGHKPMSLPDDPDHILINIHTTRADVLRAEGRYEEARRLLDWCITQSSKTAMHTCAMMASICGKQENPAEACEYLERAIDISEGSPQRTQLRLRLHLAMWQIADDRNDAAAALLDDIEPRLRHERRQQIQVLRLRAELREKKGDFESAPGYEREAAEVERELLESNRERSVRYARTLAETTLVERLADQEREQRQRLEHELAAAMIELTERTELIEEARRRLNAEITQKENGSGNDRTNAGSKGLRSILSLLQQGEVRSTSPLAYFGNAGDEFIPRLRRVYPDLTPSQERLCTLLRAGLNASELCTLLEIGSEGLKSRRKRLRRALGLKRGESLEKAIVAL